MENDSPLSPRLRQLMRLLGQGRGTEEIAARLALGQSSHVRTLLAVVCLEAGVKRGEQALVVCLRNGWITISADDLDVPLPTNARFTPRRRQALPLFLDGEPNDVISKQLGNTTAYTLTGHVMRTLGARNQYHAIAIAHVCDQIGHPLTTGAPITGVAAEK